ncbi:hypothetical protein BC835DRAFT_1378303 [Cytidiella melzeri]|nr:hypothetical protein BC835DRAFT_1378303 [Cytidiella melzeri]
MYSLLNPLASVHIASIKHRAPVIRRRGKLCHSRTARWFAERAAESMNDGFPLKAILDSLLPFLASLQEWGAGLGAGLVLGGPLHKSITRFRHRTTLGIEPHGFCRVSRSRSRHPVLNTPWGLCLLSRSVPLHILYDKTRTYHRSAAEWVPRLRMNLCLRAMSLPHPGKN